MVCYNYDPVKAYNDGKNKGKEKTVQLQGVEIEDFFFSLLVSKWCLGKKEYQKSSPRNPSAHMEKHTTKGFNNQRTEQP